MKKSACRWATPIMVALMLCSLFATVSADEPPAGLWGIEAEGGMWNLSGGEEGQSDLGPFFGLGVRRGLSEHLIATFSYRYGTVQPDLETPGDLSWPQDPDGEFDLRTEIHNPTLSFEYLFAAGNSLRPYAGLGVGMTAWRVLNATDTGLIPSGTTVQGFAEDGDEFEKLSGTNVTIAAELGLEWWASASVSFRLGARYHLLAGNDLDNVGLSSWERFGDPAYVDANTGLIQGVVGITWWLGASSDQDDDGIEDSRDACPTEAEDFDGFRDEDGCPDLDNDEDGVPDSRDSCPLDPEDRDGFQDDDGCPDPDNDGDGIIDARDGAPDEAEDIDGFEDRDGVPDLDNDGDGVPDTMDQCDGTPAGVEVDENGCPQLEPEDPAIESMDTGLVLEGVTFATGSAELQPASIDVLRRIATSLAANPDVRVEVRGYTDSTGSAEINQRLSQQRAMSVREMLIQLGVSPSRVSAVGLGEQDPVASNETRTGRMANRRVELHRIP